MIHTKRENLPEALLLFPSLATDRLLALLGVGEGGLQTRIKITNSAEILLSTGNKNQNL